METNSHQKVQDSQLQANSHPRQAAWPTRCARSSANTKTASERVWYKPLGCPGDVPGQAQA
jgi:hypothetical protein